MTDTRDMPGAPDSLPAPDLGRTPDQAAAPDQPAAPDPLAGLNARTYGPPGLEQDIEYCAQVDLLWIVPRFSGMVGRAAEIRSA